MQSIEVDEQGTAIEESDGYQHMPGKETKNGCEKQVATPKPVNLALCNDTAPVHTVESIPATQ